MSRHLLQQAAQVSPTCQEWGRCLSAHISNVLKKVTMETIFFSSIEEIQDYWTKILLGLVTAENDECEDDCKNMGVI